MRYEPCFLIGRGGMGEVWLGLQRGPEGFRRPVVLKRAGGMASGLDHEGAIAEEARLLALIDHPNVVRVIDLVKTPQGLVLVLELVRGASLRTWLSTSGPLPWEIAARLTADAARALEAAHGAIDLDGRPARVVHRDISPENLMVSVHGMLVLVDFGVARSELRELTRVPMLKGKLPYLSPEQIHGEPLDWRSDVFALGAVLYELVAGHRLFDAETEQGLLEGITTSSLPATTPLPPELERVWRAMLAPQASLRPRSLDAVATQLEALASQAGVAHGEVARELATDLALTLEQQRARIRALATGAKLAPVPATDIALGMGAVLDTFLGTRPIEPPVEPTQPFGDTTVPDRQLRDRGPS